MRKNFILYLLLVLVLLIIPGLTLPGAAESEQGNKNFLWKVSKGEHHIYILGSLHLLRKDNYPLSESFDMAYEESDNIVFEVDPGVLKLPETTKMMLSKATLEGDKTLKSTLSDKSYELTKSKLEALGLNVLMLNKSKPWFVAITTAVYKLKSLGFDGEKGVETYYYEKANTDGKKVHSLETAEFQIDLLSGFPPEIQEKLLLQTLKDLEVIEDYFDSIVSSWESGNTREFESIVMDSFKEYPTIYEKLIIDRNDNWLPVIEGYLDSDQKYLVIVGSGHLVGKDGIIRRLEQRGYQIEQM